VSFIDESVKNVELLMKEVSGGSVAGFVGRSGKDIDDLFSGPFHPDSGHGSDNEKLLQKQLDDRKDIRSDMEGDAYEDNAETVGNPSPVGGYFSDIGETEAISLAFDELVRYDQLNRDFNDHITPEQDIKWKDMGIKYDYDKAGVAYKNKDIEYDENFSLYDKKDFINASETNWLYINGENR